MRTLRQIVAVSIFNLRNLPARLDSSTVAVVGIAGVVLVFIAVLSIAVGLQKTLGSTGDEATVVVLRDGSDSELTSGLGLDETRIIADTAGLARNEDGALSSAELFVIVDVPKRGTDTEANVPLRGVSEQAVEVRQNLEIVDGRMFNPGTFEIIAGVAASESFEGVDVGAVHRWGKNEWTIVGLFTTEGSLDEAELWTDAKVLGPAYRRGNSFQSVRARLDDPASFDGFKQALQDDPRLEVKVERSGEFYASQGQATAGFVSTLGLVLAVLMGFGAVFGALNTMYTAVSARAREIATLRALGFRQVPVVVSVLVEALALALVGGVIGAVLAFFLFNGYRASTLNFQTFSQVAFAFAVTPPLMISGVVYALVMGFVGGLLPAVRAARLPVATALREL
ncbi:MAG: FtsX-like permease family protein [Acidobacteriota bacterium]